MSEHYRGDGGASEAIGCLIVALGMAAAGFVVGLIVGASFL